MNSEDHQSLALGLGFSSPSSPFKTTNHTGSKPQPMVIPGDNSHEPSLILSLSGGGEAYRNEKVVVSVKRERPEDTSSDELLDVERGGCSRVSDEDEDGSGLSNAARKKLRLTKQQSAFLEESFKQQTTLNPKQKQALADRLNLRPRQVEVWFQNRRARTKLKQTEVECEYVKKWCERLTDENRRLQKELQELKLAQPLNMQLPAATLNMCPSCERIGAGTPATATTAAFKSALAIAPNSHIFAKSSLACS